MVCVLAKETGFPARPLKFSLQNAPPSPVTLMQLDANLKDDSTQTFEGASSLLAAVINIDLMGEQNRTNKRISQEYKVRGVVWPDLQENRLSAAPVNATSSLGS
jgi:hypothetical protein